MWEPRLLARCEIAHERWRDGLGFCRRPGGFCRFEASFFLQFSSAYLDQVDFGPVKKGEREREAERERETKTLKTTRPSMEP